MSLSERLKSLAKCCLSLPEGFDLEQIDSVEAWDNDGTDEPTEAALFRLRDGRWGTFEGREDYTGHG